MKKSFFLLWGVIAAVLIFFWFYFPALSRYRDLKIKQDEIERELKALDQKIQALQQERRLLKEDKEYIEKVIRNELGLVRPGEVLYKFVEEPEKPAAQISVTSPLAGPEQSPAEKGPYKKLKPAGR